MVFLVILILIIVLFIFFLIFSSYSFKIFFYKKTNFNEILKLKNKVKGIYMDGSYFSPNHRIISKKEFKTLTKKEKLKYSFCYNSVIFKTENSNWEFFFNLEKNGINYIQILNLRVFTKINHIKTEGNIEKNLSRLNIYTNSRYLSEILETNPVREILENLVIENADNIVVNYNSLQFKSIINSKTKITVSNILDIIKDLNEIKKNIYKKGILEY